MTKIIEYKGTKLKIKKTKYVNNGRLAVTLDTTNDEPYLILTKNFPDYYIGPVPNVAFVDENNIPGDLIKILEEKEIMWKTDRFVQSGFCTYTLYGFNLDLLEG